MSLQIIENSEGKATGVFIPIKEWNKLKKQFNVLDALENNNSNLLKEIKDSFDELKKIEIGTLKARPVEDLLNEL